MSQTQVWCQFQFEAFHRWPEAPEQHAYLGVRHRHIFHVRVAWTVTDWNREREFIEEKRRAESVARGMIAAAEDWSCEHWAFQLLTALDACEVTVSEDGENGATVTR
jgi:hypothetical protein